MACSFPCLTCRFSFYFRFLPILFLILSVFPANLGAQDRENWARFRGPNGQGITHASGLPTQWSPDENILWKTPLEGEGWSSPIIWDDRIFLTTATDGGKECHVLALDVNSGRILWDKMVFHQEPRFKHGKNSYATPTPVTDGKTVYAVFGSGGIAALDVQGNILWTRDLDYYSQHGLGTSPILYKDILLLAVNPSNREEPKGLGWQTPWEHSYLLALDKETGDERWRGKRGMSRIAHATPCVIQVDGKDRILSPAGDVIQAFDPENGDLVWTVRNEGEPCVPSPGIGPGLVYSTPAGRGTILAVRPDGRGDCTETHVAWSQKRNSPMIASFLYVSPCLYTATDNGTFSCFDAATGDFLWQERIGGALSASPLYAEGKVYLLSEQGTTTVLELSKNPKEPAEVLRTNELEERALASIAVAGKRLFLRTDKHLWCIGN